MMARYSYVLLLPALIPALFLSAPATAQQTAVESASYAPDTPEPGSVEAIAEYTTAPQ
ncbi:MAG: hypothetical protein L0Y45_00320 [Woeseiaceae bacterium]|nr:hypothetical protein [Woeseiaceae bacterium]